MEDPTVPMWVIKAQGETYYVEHVTCSVFWSTKETPNNSHTKGSIKIKRCLITIGDDNVAIIEKLSLSDIARIKKNKSVRLITSYTGRLQEVLKGLPHLKRGPLKEVHGGCGTEFVIFDLFDKEQLPLLLLAWPLQPGSLRVLMPNEKYYDRYDDKDAYINSEEDWDDEEELDAV